MQCFGGAVSRPLTKEKALDKTRKVLTDHVWSLYEDHVKERKHGETQVKKLDRKQCVFVLPNFESKVIAVEVPPKPKIQHRRFSLMKSHDVERKSSLEGGRFMPKLQVVWKEDYEIKILDSRKNEVLTRSINFQDIQTLFSKRIHQVDFDEGEEANEHVLYIKMPLRAEARRPSLTRQVPTDSDKAPRLPPETSSTGDRTLSSDGGSDLDDVLKGVPVWDETRRPSIPRDSAAQPSQQSVLARNTEGGNQREEQPAESDAPRVEDGGDKPPPPSPPPPPPPQQQQPPQQSSESTKAGSSAVERGVDGYEKAEKEENSSEDFQDQHDGEGGRL